jgi:hypothetical protein
VADGQCREGSPTVQPVHCVVGFPVGVEPEGLETLDEGLKRGPVRPFQRSHTQAEPNLVLAFGYPQVRDPGLCLRWRLALPPGSVWALGLDTAVP